MSERREKLEGLIEEFGHLFEGCKYIPGGLKIERVGPDIGLVAYFSKKGFKAAEHGLPASVKEERIHYWPINGFD